MTVSDVILSLRYAHGPLTRLASWLFTTWIPSARLSRWATRTSTQFRLQALCYPAMPEVHGTESDTKDRQYPFHWWTPPCRPTLRTISCRVSSPTKVGLFNARSVASSGKSQSISTWVSELKLTVAGRVETWHDGPETPALVACAPPAWLRVYRAITAETWPQGG